MPPRRPLRFTVPAGLFAVGLIIIVAYYLAEQRTLAERIREDGYRELRMLAALSTGDIEHAYRSGNLKEARATIERLGGLPALSKAAMVTAGGLVIYAARPGLEGTPLASYLDEVDPGRIQEILAGRDVMLLDRCGGLCQAGFFPVLIRDGSSSLIPAQFGWLVLESDLTGTAALRRNNLLARTTPYIVALIAICIGLWWTFRKVLLHRIQRLASVTRDIAMGDFSVVPDIGGRDELNDLSGELARMASRLRENTNELAFLSGHDALTHLLNRRGFEQRLVAAIEEAKFRGTAFLLLYLDLDNFRVLNDTQGHTAGDGLIVHVSEVLNENLDKTAVLARTGGDEFGIILPLRPGQDPAALAESLRRIVVGVPFEWKGQPCHVQASIGAVSVDGRLSAEEALSRADTACSAAKDRGRNRIQFWSDDEQELLLHHGHMKWVGRIQAALDSGRFELHGQEIVPLQHESRGLYFEVLIRMRDEQGNLCPPGDFLPAAERFHLSTRIDRWVIAEVFNLLDMHRSSVRDIETCTINLSGPSLCDDDTLDAIKREIAKHAHIRPTQICFEITETAAITNLAKAVRFIEELRGMDFRIALDDFGSGVSSFGYLKNLPVDIIKIDGMFVRDLLNSPLDGVITRSINDIAHEMGKRTIAEFAETAPIIQALRDIGVDYAQGYGVAKPVPLYKLLQKSLREAI
jgi:diguanylate cyclase (GGDEF)-like protein